MHVDTGHNFGEVLESATGGRRLASGCVGRRAGVHRRGRVTEETGRHASRNRLQTVTLLGRDRGAPVRRAVRRRAPGRGEARAKERVFSFRDEFGQWDPKEQRPELWSRTTPGCAVRAHPPCSAVQLDELDVWAYIEREKLDIPSIYFRPRAARCSSGTACCSRTNPYVLRGEDEPLFTATVRYRTVGDMTCTGRSPRPPGRWPR